MPKNIDKEAGAGSGAATDITAARFGTFGGVFTPNVLTILGVVLFLRAGWVVGNAGLMGAITIIIIAHLISFSTGMSLSAIATSMNVKAGGKYYMISRKLGIEIGGSIGIPLYLSQALSVAFYIIGFTEGLQWVFPGINPILISSFACVILLVIAFTGADFAIKVQFVILGLLGLSLLSFFFGGTTSEHEIIMWNEGGAGFWPVFAIFFPAVTGIGVGVSMSGDLKDSGRSIPRGTLFSIGVTFVIYLLQAVWFSINVPTEELISNLSIMKDVAFIPALIPLGLWMATISSALGCIMAAPRTMQAIAKDSVLPKFFSKGSGKNNEPRIALVVTFIIAESCILIGGLDVIAPVITMFFLNTYGVINLIAALENLVGNPSYRPKINIHWLISLAGAIGCYAVMFLINGTATIFAIIITLFIYVHLGRKEIRSTWGDVRSGLWYSLARFSILKLEGSKWHPLNWRPNVIVFAHNPKTQEYLLNLANWLGGGKGLVTMYRLIFGEGENMIYRRNSSLTSLKKSLQSDYPQVLSNVCLTDNLLSGVRQVVQSHGFGLMQPNLVLLGWSYERKTKVELAEMIRDVIFLQKSVLVLNISDENPFLERKRIDIWWGGLQNNGTLMIVLAHLISLNPEWEDCTVRLNMIIKNEEGKKPASKNMKDMLEQAHIEADTNIIVQKPDETIPYIIRKESKRSNLVILGMGLPAKGREAKFMEHMSKFLEGLPTTLLVKNVEDIELIH
jgi:amino acid transporter